MVGFHNNSRLGRGGASNPSFRIAVLTWAQRLAGPPLPHLPTALSGTNHPTGLSRFGRGLKVDATKVARQRQRRRANQPPNVNHHPPQFQ